MRVRSGLATCPLVIGRDDPVREGADPVAGPDAVRDLAPAGGRARLHDPDDAARPVPGRHHLVARHDAVLRLRRPLRLRVRHHADPDLHRWLAQAGRHARPLELLRPGPGETDWLIKAWKLGGD